MTELILGVGYPGAGKTTIKEFTTIPSVSMGDVVREKFHEEVDENKIENSDVAKSDLIGKWITKKREEKGEDIVVKYVTNKIRDTFDSDYIFVDGVRTIQEYDYFMREFDDVHLLYVKSSFTERLRRIQSRGREGESTFTEKDLEERDEREEGWGVRELIDEKAEYVVENNGTLDEFEQKVKTTINEEIMG